MGGGGLPARLRPPPLHEYQPPTGRPISTPPPSSRKSPPTQPPFRGLAVRSDAIPLVKDLAYFGVRSGRCFHRLRSPRTDTANTCSKNGEQAGPHVSDIEHRGISITTAVCVEQITRPLSNRSCCYYELYFERCYSARFRQLDPIGSSILQTGAHETRLHNLSRNGSSTLQT